jgi:catechol 2,3-dioxygenase-like lactoylglutathione lyase family enzyme
MSNQGTIRYLLQLKAFRAIRVSTPRSGQLLEDAIATRNGSCDARPAVSAARGRTMKRAGWLLLSVTLASACASEDGPSARSSEQTIPAHGGSGARNTSGAPELCSGCASEMPDSSDLGVRLHHVHMNVKDVRQTIAFYAEHFGAREVWLNGRESAVWADPILLLLQESGADAPDTLQMGFEHVGMGVSNPSAWFDQASQTGVEIDTRNGAPSAAVSMPAPDALRAFLDEDVDTFAYVYVRGPNRERVEVWSGLAKFRHAHFMTPDVDATVAFYDQLFGTQPIVANAAVTGGFGNGIALANDVQLFFASFPAIAEFVRTDDRPLGHIAFSVTDLARQFARIEQLGVTIVSTPSATEHGFRSFFVRGPQDVLIEFVEAGPLNGP